MVRCLLSFDDLSPKEQSAVQQLKQRMVGQMNPEMYEDLNVFVRFLRARDLNINAAEAMLRKHIEWRKIHQVDTMLRDHVPKEVLEKYFTMNNIGSDKEGSPIFFFNLGQIDSRGILKSVRKIDVIKFVIHLLEGGVKQLEERSLKEGRHIDKFTMILNFDGLSLAVATHKETLAIVGSLFVLYEANYPERLKIACAINASIYFTMGFAVVKHFLSGPTLRKVHIYGRDGWREDILKLIDPEVLPAFLGGTRTDPDGNPLCHSIITHGGFVPESYYIKNRSNSIAKLPGIKKITVTRMSKTQLTVDITEPGSHIEWEFETASRDIGFSLLYKESQTDNICKEIIPKQRVDTNISSETGTLKCEMPGIYVIEFDNSYSWIFQKEVYYKVNVVKDSITVD